MCHISVSVSFVVVPNDYIIMVAKRCHISIFLDYLYSRYLKNVAELSGLLPNDNIA